MSTNSSSQIIFNKNNLSFDFSINSFINNDFFTKKKASKKLNIFEYITKLNQFYSKNNSSWFFKTGWYVNQSIIESFCTNINDLTSSIFAYGSIFIQKFNKYGINFQIRNISELNYMKIICKINQRFNKTFVKLQSKFNLKDYFRFFYILYNSGGKSVSDTNKVFSVATHSPFRNYFIQNDKIYNKTIIFNPSFFQYVDYSISHMLHFRKNIDYVFKQPIFPSYIGFDNNYLDLFKTY